MAYAVLHAQICFLMLSATFSGIEDNYACGNENVQYWLCCYTRQNLVSDCIIVLVFRTTMGGAMRKQCRE